MSCCGIEATGLDGRKVVESARLVCNLNSMKNAVKALFVFALCALNIPLAAQTASSKYVEGQVWSYKTRPQDTGSLLKIQKIAINGRSRIYHISIVGLHFSSPGIAGMLPHIPVSDATLDASVTKLATTSETFPNSSLEAGIDEWRKANGGVFTIPVAQIIDIVDKQTAQALSSEEN
jgi:hypothetical protein